MAVFAVGLCTTSGCEDEEATKAASAAHTFTNETVTVAVPKGMGFSEGWKGLLDEWGEQTGAAYRLVEYEDGTAAKKDLPTADLFILPFAEMGEFVAADRLSLMPPALTSGDSATAWLDYFSGLQPRTHDWRCSGDHSVFVSGFDLLLPAGLAGEGGQEAAAHVGRISGAGRIAAELGAGTLGRRAVGTGFCAMLFLARALSVVKGPGTFSVCFDIDSGEPLIDSPGFVRALSNR